jgi:CheY-like chemotaxis protein
LLTAISVQQPELNRGRAHARNVAAIPLDAAAKEDLFGGGTILVVGDEEVVRVTAKQALERQGYQVPLAESGPSAIEAFNKYPGEIALVVLDLSMPGMGGEEVLPELRKIRPQIKVTVASGYTESQAMKLFGRQQVSGFLQKPFTSRGLAQKVKVAPG